jgi:hypothetical protein
MIVVTANTTNTTESDTPIMGEKPTAEDELFCKACDELKEKFNLDCMIVSAMPKVQADAEQTKNLLFISTNDDPFFLLETTANLTKFYIEREQRNLVNSRNRALSILAMLEKVVTNKVDKPQN